MTSNPRHPQVDGNPKCFICYRRIDAGQCAFWLAREIEEFFGPECVFVDAGIEGGADWTSRIKHELEIATAVLVLIGPKWLHASDENGKRCIDQKNDWVRLELTHANNGSKKAILPILLEGQAMPAPKALPHALKFLPRLQAIDLHPSTIDDSYLKVIKFLEQNGFTQFSRIDVPRPPEGDNRYALADNTQLKDFLRDNHDWSVQYRQGADRNKPKRKGIGRDYAFASFQDAIDFIADAARDITRIRHYPEWENVWRTVRVWYSCWNLNGQISNYDLQMARDLDILYSHFHQRPHFIIPDSTSHANIEEHERASNRSNRQVGLD